MKRVVFFVLIAVGLAPVIFAQRPETDHVQVGASADYFRLPQTNTDFAGLGGRLTSLNSKAK
jgi:hypothetical protein